MVDSHRTPRQWEPSRTGRPHRLALVLLTVWLVSVGTAMGIALLSGASAHVQGPDAPQGIQMQPVPPEAVVVGTRPALTFQLTDANDNPLQEAGIEVQVVIIEAPLPRQVDSLLASADPPVMATNASGQATTTLTVGHTSGSIRLGVITDTIEEFVLSALPDRDSAHLVEVSGNNQVAAPGEELEEPLVVQLEDQFGNPIVGEEVTAEVIEGDGEVRTEPSTSQVAVMSLPFQASTGSMVTVRTDDQGEARFFLRVGTENVVTRATSALTPEEVEFFTFVGFAKLTDIAVEANGNLVVADAGLQAVIRVNPSSGHRTLISGYGRGEGPPFAEPLGIAVEANGSLVVVGRVKKDSGREPYAVMRVDPVEGHRTVVSSNIDPENPSNPPIGTGPGFERPRDIAVGKDGTLWVVDGDHGLGLHAVVKLEVDPMNPNRWNRTIFSGVDPDTDQPKGSGPEMFFPRDIAVAADNTLLVTGLWSNKLGTNCHDESSKDDCFDGVARITSNGDRVLVAREEPKTDGVKTCPTLGPLGVSPPDRF